MGNPFNSLWNRHYCFEDEANKAEICHVENYRLDSDKAGYRAGQTVYSPWGSNLVVEAGHRGGQDICLKSITINPGYMLSLQRHRGRDEEWNVTEGSLTIIVNGERYEIAAGQSFTLSRGSVHSMMNATHKSLVVREMQKGICREKDNVRLLDFNNRPTYPITSGMEFKSARLYARIQAEFAKRFGRGHLPHESLLTSA